MAAMSRSRQAEGSHRPLLVGLQVVLVALVVTALITLALGWPALRQQLRASFTHEPDRYTSLAFTPGVALPARLAPGVPNPFSFTIGNHEAGATTYAYTVTAQGPGGTATVSSGQVRILAGRSAAEVVAFTPPESPASYVLTVRLVGHGGELIHFQATS
jgi:Tfp pilus assembly protein PilX